MIVHEPERRIINAFIIMFIELFCYIADNLQQAST